MLTYFTLQIFRVVQMMDDVIAVFVNMPFNI